MTLRRLLPIVLCLPLLLAGCATTNGGTVQADCLSGYRAPDLINLQTRLDAARARWASANTLNYRYELSFYAEPSPGGAYRYEVAEGRVTSVTPLTERTPTPSDPSFGSIPDRFDEVQRYINAERTRPAADCHFIEVTFDPADGHVATLDGGYLSPNIADGGGGYQITHFTRL